MGAECLTETSGSLTETPRTTIDTSRTVPCDVCEGRREINTVSMRIVGDQRVETPTKSMCPRCRGKGRIAERSDPMAAPHVDVSVPIFGGSIRLRSASGGLESLWIDVRDADGAEVVYDRATGQHMQPAVRLTPRDARALSDLLRRYADTHRETE